MKFKHRVFLGKFPFDDASDKKVRPVLCLSNPIGPEFHVVVAFIGSQIPVDVEPFDMIIESDTPSAKAMGLKKRSLLRPHRLFTTDASLLKRDLGRLPTELAPEVDKRLRSLLGL